MYVHIAVNIKGYINVQLDHLYIVTIGRKGKILGALKIIVHMTMILLVVKIRLLELSG